MSSKIKRQRRSDTRLSQRILASNDNVDGGHAEEKEHDAINIEETHEDGSFSFSQSEYIPDVQVISCTARDVGGEFGRISSQEKAKLVSAVTRYILFKGSRQEMIDITKLTKDVFGGALKEYKVSKRFVLGEAQKILENICGFQLIQANDKFKKKQPGLKDQWFLVNTLSEEKHSRDVLAAHSSERRGLLMVVLAFTFMERPGAIQATKLMDRLAQIDQRVATNDNLARNKFGSTLQGCLDDFVKQKYLLHEAQEIESTGEKTNEYRLGPRAIAEVGKRQILHTIFEVLDETVDEALLLDLSDDESFVHTDS